MRRKAKGFTLIELMIVVVIVAILAAVAIPNYTEYVKRSRRTAATTTLHATISALEKYLLNNNVYPPDIDTLIAGDATNQGVGIQGLKQVGSDWQTEDGNYTVVLGTSGGVATGAVAQITTSGSQASDTDCRMFVLNLDGTRIARNASMEVTTEQCWAD